MIKTNDENLYLLIERIANHLNMPFDASNILDATRLASKNQKDVQPALVCCVNTNVKYEFMNAFKEKPIMCDEIGLGVKQHFFINHHHHQEI